MSNFSEKGIEDVLWLGTRLSGILELVPQLQEVNSLTQAVSEKTAEKDSLDTQIKTLKSEKARLEDEVSSLNKRNQASVKDIADKIKKTQEEASIVAADIIGKAKEQAKAVTEAAKADVLSLEGAKDNLQADITKLKIEYGIQEQRLINIKDKVKNLGKELING